MKIIKPEFTIENIDLGNITVSIICDRNTTRWWSQYVSSHTEGLLRDCGGPKRFSDEIIFIQPCWDPSGFAYKTRMETWKTAMEKAEMFYLKLLDYSFCPSIDSVILPDSLKTDIIITLSRWEWRDFFMLVHDVDFQIDFRIKNLALPMLKEFQKKIPVTFDDIDEIVF